MSISRSRAPKGQRTAREFETELLPDPTDYFHSARYIDRRAELGDFTRKEPDVPKDKRRPAPALPVLHYLWRHAVRNGENPNLGAFEREGYVLTGKSKLGKIATECGIAYNTANKAVLWLAEQEWLDIDHGSGQGFNIRVKMDLEGHNERMTLLGLPTVTSGGTVTDGPSHQEGRPVTSGGTVVSPDGTVPHTRSDTQQGSFRDLERDSDESDGREANPKINTPAEAFGSDHSEDAEPSQEDVILARKRRLVAEEDRLQQLLSGARWNAEHSSSPQVRGREANRAKGLEARLETIREKLGEASQ